MKALAILFTAIVVIVALGCMGSGGSVSTTNTGSTATNTNGGGGSTVPVTMNGMLFSPVTVNAHPGDTVQWTNQGTLPHTVTSDTAEPNLDSSTQFPAGITQNQTFSWTVPGNATIGHHYFYHCNFHGAAGNGSALGTGMAGEIVVN